MAKNFSNRLKNLAIICGKACLDKLRIQIIVKGSEEPIQMDDILESGKVFVKGNIYDKDSKPKEVTVKFVDIVQVLVFDGFYDADYLNAELFEKELYQ